MRARQLRPGVGTYWREPGVWQVALDPRCAVVLEDLDPTTQALLEALPKVRGELELNAMARTFGVGRAPVRALLAQLQGHGYLIEEASVIETPDDRYWHLAAIAGEHRSSARAAATIRVIGLCELGLRIARILVQAGVGRVLLEDGARVHEDDLSPDGYTVADLGKPRAHRALALLRATSPRAQLTAPPGCDTDLVVLVQHGVVDPVAVRSLTRADQRHLPVLVRELDAVVGPVVDPGATPCLRCLDLWRCEDDPGWPVIATQVAVRPPSGTETSLAWLAAALAAHQALAVVDGRGVLLAGASIEVSATYPLPRYREWSVHPDCGCTQESVIAAAGPAASAGPQ